MMSKNALDFYFSSCFFSILISLNFLREICIYWVDKKVVQHLLKIFRNVATAGPNELYIIILNSFVWFLSKVNGYEGMKTKGEA